MNTVNLLIVVAVAGLIHASFQLSISVLTLLSSHSIGRKNSHARLVAMTNSFLFGVGVMTLLILSFVAFVMSHYLHYLSSPLFLWSIGCGLLVGLGVAVWLFYYRHRKGTTLWIPRSLAQYLGYRTKSTKTAGEAFGLGLTSVIAETLFIIAPVFVSGLALASLSPAWQLGGIALYAVISLAPMVIVSGLVGSGHSLSRIQKWRESNKSFLQFAAGAGLIVLGIYVYVEQVVTTTVMATAGGM